MTTLGESTFEELSNLTFTKVEWRGVLTLGFTLTSGESCTAGTRYTCENSHNFDSNKKITKVGIHLPDRLEIPTITGRVVAISAEVAKDENYPIEQYDRVLFNPKHGVPVDFEGDNRLFVIPIEDIVAVFRAADAGQSE